MGKKQKVIEELYLICQNRNDFKFNNELVKEVCKKIGVGNPFDVTKIDNKKVLPANLLEKDVAIIHLGSGWHQFIKGISSLYHNFEPIQEEIFWDYRKSILNQYNTSESNILSVANNQRILHNFAFGQDKEFNDEDIIKRPKTYFPHRTKVDLNYHFGNSIHVDLKSMQVEIDLTIEFEGNIAVFEAKNGKADNFSVYQLFHPFLYYYNAKKRKEFEEKIKEISGVYVVKQIIKGETQLKLWKYNFTNPMDITSIIFVKSACYKLVKKNG